MALTGSRQDRGVGQAPRKVQGWIVWAWVVAVVLSGAYTAWWFVLAQQIEQRAAVALEGRAEWDTLSVSGWPYRLTVAATSLVAPLPGGGQLSADRFAVTTTPFNLRLWVFDRADGLRIRIGDGPVRKVEARLLAGSVRVRSDGGLERFSVQLGGLSAAAEGPDGRGWDLDQGEMHLVHDPRNPERFAFMADLRQLRLTQALAGPGAILGDTITHARIAGPIDQAESLIQSVEVWQRAGGRFELMAGELLWGPLSFTELKGQIGLDALGLAEGEIAGVGALRPEGVPVGALSSPVSARLRGGNLEVFGLSIGLVPALR